MLFRGSTLIDLHWFMQTHSCEKMLLPSAILRFVLPVSHQPPAL